MPTKRLTQVLSAVGVAAGVGLGAAGLAGAATGPSKAPVPKTATVTNQSGAAQQGSQNHVDATEANDTPDQVASGEPKGADTDNVQQGDQNGPQTPSAPSSATR